MLWLSALLNVVGPRLVTRFEGWTTLLGVAPIALVLMVSAPLAGRLVTRFGNKALVATGEALCFRCHSEKRVALQKPGAHEGAKGDCLVCHVPHAADARGLVPDERNLEPATRLCAALGL